MRFVKIVLSMPAAQVVHPRRYPAERAYAVRVVLGEWLGLQYTLAEGTVEAWELHCNGAVVSLPDSVFGTPEEEWVTVDAADDVFGRAFLLVTRYEETVLAERNEHDRFPVTATGQDIDRPEGDQLVLSLRRQLAKVAPGLETRWHPFRVVPSHDVDYPFASPRLRVSALRHGQMRASLPRDPFDTFDLLMDEDERRGLRATFFFLADGAGGSTSCAGRTRRPGWRTKRPGSPTTRRSGTPPAPASARAPAASTPSSISPHGGSCACASGRWC